MGDDGNVSQFSGANLPRAEKMMSSMSPRKEAPSAGIIPDEDLANDWDLLGSQLDLSRVLALSGYNPGTPEGYANHGSRVECASQLPSLAGFPDSHSTDGQETGMRKKKRKNTAHRTPFVPGSPLINIEDDVECDAHQQNDMIPDLVRGPMEINEKRLRAERAIGRKAKRVRATSSHSLAERVRRENIAERMRILQDIVPGCDKVTGKALMLDEIINYVLSLQRQVEFLYMKLAAFEPQQNAEITNSFANDVVRSEEGTAASLGYDSGICSCRSLPHEFNPQVVLMQPQMVIPNIPYLMAHEFTPLGVLIQPQMVTPSISSSMPHEFSPQGVLMQPQMVTANIPSSMPHEFNPQGVLMQQHIVTPDIASALPHELNPQGVLMQPQMVTPNIPSSMQASGQWDHELQNVTQMGFVPNMPLGNGELDDLMNVHQPAIHGLSHLTLLD